MSQNRPMSEFEGALFDAVLAIGTTMLELGADPAVFRARLTAARDAADKLGNRHGAGTLDFLIGGLFTTPDPPPKRSFRII